MPPPPIVQAGYQLAGRCSSLARLDEAEAVVEEAQELALRLGDPTWERSGTQRVAALIALERGDWRNGLEDVERVIADEPTVTCTSISAKLRRPRWPGSRRHASTTESSSI